MTPGEDFTDFPTVGRATDPAPRPYLTITKQVLRDAIWQAFYHCELDTFAHAVRVGDIDGNNHPALLGAADAIWERLT